MNNIFKEKLKNFTKSCDVLSKISAVLFGVSIPLSVTAKTVLASTTISFFILGGDWYRKFMVISKNKIALLMLLLFSLYVIRMGHSHAPSAQILDGFHKYSKLLYVIILMPLFVDKRWREIGIYAFLVAMLITLICSYLKLFGLLHIRMEEVPAAVFRSHIESGFMMAIAAFIILHKAVKANNYLRWIYAILFCLATYNIFFLNSSRTGYLAFITLLVTFLIQKLKKKGVIITLVFLPLLSYSLFLTSNTFHDRIILAFQDVQQYQQRTELYTSIGDRLGFIKHSWQLIKQRPVFGWGTGSFEYQYKTQFPPVPGFEKGLASPHNEYLITTEQLGIVGLFVLLYLFYTQFRYSFKLSEENKYFSQGLLLAFIAASFCDTFLFLTTSGFIYVYFSSLFYADLTENHEQ